MTPKARARARLGVLLAVLALCLAALWRIGPRVLPAAPRAELPHGAVDAGPTPPPLPSLGCGHTPDGGTRDRSDFVMVDGQRRKYLVVLPRGYVPTRPYPLLFAFHGSGGNGEGYRSWLDLESYYGDAVIAVYPDAVVRRIWAEEVATHWGRVEDLPFFDAMLDAIGREHCVDRARVLATGWSSGGYFANQLACARPDAVRAIASLSGGGPEQIDCPRPHAAFIFHDRDDHAVMISEGRASRDHWRTTNACGRSRTEGTCEVYTGCAAPLVGCETSGNGHGVPPSVRAAMWSFLSAF